MGFEESLSAEALRQTDNNSEQALHLLLTNPHLLRGTTEPRAEDLELKVLQVTALGFSVEEARGTLKATFGNVEEAIDLLLKGQGTIELPTSGSDSGSTEPAPKVDETLTDVVNNNVNNTDDNEAMQVDEENERKKQDEEEFIQDVPKDDDAYLDVDLTDESRILQQYKALIM
jgi:hypothetical protein